MPTTADTQTLCPEVVQLARTIRAEGASLVVDAAAFAEARDKLMSPSGARGTAAEQVVALALRIGREAGAEIDCTSVLQALGDAAAALLGSEVAAKGLFRKTTDEARTRLQGEAAPTPHPPMNQPLWK